MGKISDAIKKVTEERERNRHIQSKQIIEEVKKKEEDVVASEISFQKDITLKEKIKEKINRLKPDLFYLAKRTDTSGIDPRVVTYFDYFAPVSEQYCALRTNISSYLFNEIKSTRLNPTTLLIAPKIFTITSALPGEGKTVTCVNLAISLSKELDSKILLMDCDLRNGTVHNLLNLGATPGLADILTYDLDYSAALHPTQLENLFIIPRGNTPSNPTEILGSKKMRLIMEKLKTESFTYIIIDTPPLLPFTDAGVLGVQTNGVILVVQAHRTQARVIKRAKELLDQAHNKFLGFIITQTDYNIQDSYSYYYRYKNYEIDQPNNLAKSFTIE